MTKIPMTMADLAHQCRLLNALMRIAESGRQLRGDLLKGVVDQFEADAATLEDYVASREPGAKTPSLTLVGGATPS